MHVARVYLDDALIYLISLHLIDGPSTCFILYWCIWLGYWRQAASLTRSNVPSLKKKERGQSMIFFCLRSVLLFPAVLSWHWFEGHLAWQNLCHLSSEIVFQNSWKKRSEGETAYLEMAVKMEIIVTVVA